jgi:hypothetical protein
MLGVARLRKPRTIQPPFWSSERGRGRVLIENQDGAELWAHAGALQEAGYDAVTCFGPSPKERVTCPLVTGEGCQLVETADVVISTTRLADGGEVLAAVRRCHPHALIVEDADAVGPVIEQRRLLAAVEAALQGESATGQRA